MDAFTTKSIYDVRVSHLLKPTGMFTLKKERLLFKGLILFFLIDDLDAFIEGGLYSSVYGIWFRETFYFIESIKYQMYFMSSISIYFDTQDHFKNIFSNVNFYD